MTDPTLHLPPDVEPPEPTPPTVVADILVDQPSPRPSRKIAGVGWFALAGTVATAVVAQALPELSVACGQELGGILGPTVLAALIGGGATLTGYLRHERA